MNEMEKYLAEWGNYKSDKWKSQRILRSEIQDMLHIFKFNKKELVEIKNFMLNLKRKV